MRSSTWKKGPDDPWDFLRNPPFQPTPPSPSKRASSRSCDNHFLLRHLSGVLLAKTFFPSLCTFPHLTRKNRKTKSRVKYRSEMGAIWERYYDCKRGERVSPSGPPSGLNQSVFSTIVPRPRGILASFFPCRTLDFRGRAASLQTVGVSLFSLVFMFSCLLLARPCPLVAICPRSALLVSLQPELSSPFPANANDQCEAVWPQPRGAESETETVFER